jgi:hypothetical protein
MGCREQLAIAVAPGVMLSVRVICERSLRRLLLVAVVFFLVSWRRCSVLARDAVACAR